MEKKSNKKWAKALILISLLFVNIGLVADDVLISHDGGYFNPLAIPFKWDIKLYKKLAPNQSIQIEYQLYNNKKQIIIWKGKQVVKLKDNSFSIYLLITEMTSKTSEPSIVVAIPNQQTTRFNAQGCKYSNSVLFTGESKIISNFGVFQKLLNTSLLKSNQHKAKQGIFSIMHVSADKAEAVCNLNIDFSIKITIINSLSSK